MAKQMVYCGPTRPAGANELAGAHRGGMSAPATARKVGIAPNMAPRSAPIAAPQMPPPPKRRGK